LPSRSRLRWTIIPRRKNKSRDGSFQANHVYKLIMRHSTNPYCNIILQQ
jgi:hypothetical protein